MAEEVEPVRKRAKKASHKESSKRLKVEQALKNSVTKKKRETESDLEDNDILLSKQDSQTKEKGFVRLPYSSSQ